MLHFDKTLYSNIYSAKLPTPAVELLRCCFSYKSYLSANLAL